MKSINPIQFLLGAAAMIAGGWLAFGLGGAVLAFGICVLVDGLTPDAPPKPARKPRASFDRPIRSLGGDDES